MATGHIRLAQLEAALSSAINIRYFAKGSTRSRRSRHTRWRYSGTRKLQTAGHLGVHADKASIGKVYRYRIRPSSTIVLPSGDRSKLANLSATKNYGILVNLTPTTM